jgi:hypothetical protein
VSKIANCAIACFPFAVEWIDAAPAVAPKIIGAASTAAATRARLDVLLMSLSPYPCFSSGSVTIVTPPARR